MSKDHARTIIELRDADLQLRDALINPGELWDGYHPEMMALHGRNADILSGIIDDIGYPTVEKVGKDASAAAWLVIQHAIAKPDFMRRCLDLLELAVEEGDGDAVQLAYLSDRIAVCEDRPQLYGTQFDWTEEGVLRPKPVDDVVLVNKRRKSLGLGTLDQQIEQMRDSAQREGQQPPLDFYDHKQKEQEWKKSVGWID